LLAPVIVAAVVAIQVVEDEAAHRHPELDSLIVNNNIIINIIYLGLDPRVM